MSVALTVVATPLRAEIIDRVLAVVNGTVLMQSDVYGAMAIGLVNTAGTVDPVAFALEQIVERELVLAEVNRYAPPEPPEAEIAARVAQVRARFPSPEAFQRALVVSGLSEERLRTIQRDELRIETYLNQRFGAASAERTKAIADWTTGLRRRAEITMNVGRTLLTGRHQLHHPARPYEPRPEARAVSARPHIDLDAKAACPGLCADFKEDQSRAGDQRTPTMPRTESISLRES